MIFSSNYAVKNDPIALFIDNNNEDQNDPNLKLPLTQINKLSPKPYIKFLGILLDPDLSFKEHILHISSQISKGLFFLRKSKNLFSQHCLQSIYYTLIHSYLTYGINIWSCTNTSNLNQIFKKQKSAIRIVCDAKFNAHTQPLFKSLRILPLVDLIYYFNICFMQNYHQNHLPESFSNYWPTNRVFRNATNDDLLLRNDFNLHLPFSRLKSTSLFPFFNLPRLWTSFYSDLPSLSIIRNKVEFKVKLKDHLLSKLQSNIRCDWLFCHSCSIYP